MANETHGRGRHLVAEAILQRALGSLIGVQAAVVPAFRQPSESESEAMAAIDEARARLRDACHLLHHTQDSAPPQA